MQASQRRLGVGVNREFRQLAERMETNNANGGNGTFVKGGALAILLFFCFFPLLVAHADVAVSGSLPQINIGLATSSQDAASIPAYITRIYQFAIGISGIVAVGMIVAGAIMISVSAGNTSLQGEGKDMITSALWGIVLLFGAYLVLQTVNPGLVLLREPNAPVAGPTSSTGSTLTPEQQNEAQQIRNRLASGGVQINNPECANLTDTLPNCTSVYGLPTGAVDHLIDIKRNCNCEVMVTGGTEKDHHTAHGYGRSVVDLRYNKTLADYLKNSYLSKIFNICTTDALAQYRYRCGFTENQTHLHIVFKRYVSS